MEKDFQYLISQWGEDEAEKRFNEACYKLIDRMYGLVFSVTTYPGDFGMDIHLNINDDITVYQCRFFYGRVNATQQKNVEDSVANIMTSDYWPNVSKYVLCIATDLNSEENTWWVGMSEELKATSGKMVDLMQEVNLIGLLKLNALYEDIFEVEP